MENIPELKKCPNCGKKKSIWSELNIVSQKHTDFINKFCTPQKDGFCTECVPALYNNLNYQFDEERKNLIELLEKSLDAIPVITLQNPFGWEYEILEMISAQTTTGTGAITEVFAQIADFMGEQSDRHNSKIKIAENLCKNHLRHEALSLGGNAVIACDIHISTAGVGNGLIILCMSGTAVKLTNLELMPDRLQKINEILNIKIKIAELNGYFQIMSDFLNT